MEFKAGAEFIEFVRQHENDDPTRLLLAARKYPGVDVRLAA